MIRLDSDQYQPGAPDHEHERGDPDDVDPTPHRARGLPMVHTPNQGRQPDPYPVIPINKDARGTNPTNADHLRICIMLSCRQLIPTTPRSVCSALISTR